METQHKPPKSHLDLAWTWRSEATLDETRKNNLGCLSYVNAFIALRNYILPSSVYEATHSPTTNGEVRDFDV